MAVMQVCQSLASVSLSTNQRWVKAFVSYEDSNLTRPLLHPQALTYTCYSSLNWFTSPFTRSKVSINEIRMIATLAMETDRLSVSFRSLSSHPLLSVWSHRNEVHRCLPPPHPRWKHHSLRLRHHHSFGSWWSRGRGIQV